jgi:predicted TIM-barrel fold metal-dependent hydrolase
VTTDVATYVGAYPYRQLPDVTTGWLLKQMDRLDIERAWVGHLPSAFSEPRAGAPELLRLLKPHRDRLLPVPAVHPGLPRFVEDLNDARVAGAPAVRVYPMQLGLDPAGGEMRVLAGAAASAGLPILLTVRFEDGRQRHPQDQAGELPAAGVRALVRADPQVRLLVSHADRSFIEEVHFGSTPEEARRILWDIAWVWGPPEDHLALLIETMGLDRFTFGTGMPLRIPDSALARLDLLGLKPNQRHEVLSGNLDRWLAACAAQ